MTNRKIVSPFPDPIPLYREEWAIEQVASVDPETAEVLAVYLTDYVLYKDRTDGKDRELVDRIIGLYHKNLVLYEPDRESDAT